MVLDGISQVARMSTLIMVMGEMILVSVIGKYPDMHNIKAYITAMGGER